MSATRLAQNSSPCMEAPKMRASILDASTIFSFHYPYYDPILYPYTLHCNPIYIYIYIYTPPYIPVVNLRHGQLAQDVVVAVAVRPVVLGQFALGIWPCNLRTTKPQAYISQGPPTYEHAMWCLRTCWSYLLTKIRAPWGVTKVGTASWAHNLNT